MSLSKINEVIMREQENSRTRKGATGMLCQMSIVGSVVLEVNNMKKRTTSTTQNTPAIGHLTKFPDALLLLTFTFPDQFFFRKRKIRNSADQKTEIRTLVTNLN